MEIAIQIADVVTAVIGALQKKKSLSLIFYLLNNVVLAAMFFVFGKVSAGLICIIAIVRFIVFLLFSVKKLKPNIFVLIAFEIVYLISTILTFENALDFFPMIGTMISCYTSWQDNTAVMRIGYIINPIFYTIYKVIIGAYISIITEVILLLSNVISLVYYDILKKETPIFALLKKNKCQEGLKEDFKEPENIETQNIEPENIEA